MPDIQIQLKPFHACQKEIYRGLTKRSIGRCGRRWGKTTLFEEAASNWAAHGLRVGWFSPNYKLLLPSYKRILRNLKPIVEHASKIDALIETISGGGVEFWTLNDEDAGRSRAYHKVIIDEAGLVKKGLRETWEQAIEPTLLDYHGDAVMVGTPKGIDEENFFYVACTNKQLGWTEFHAPTSANPTLNAEAVAKIKNSVPPLVYLQEYLAEFVDWSGAMFFKRDDMLDETGAPFPYPTKCDSVFATLDTAVKTGKENDGTGIVYWAYSRWPEPELHILDWDIVQIEGSLLEKWLPESFVKLEQFAQVCGARHGSLGTHIEDKASGTILIQQGARRGWPTHAIESDLTAMGKEERALSISGYVHQKRVKLTVHAFDKVVTYKELTRNHLLTQVLGFKIGVKDQADDLFDAFCYGPIIALGNYQGY